MRSSLLVLPLVLWACGIEAEGSLDPEGSGGSNPTGTSGQGGKASAGSAGKQGGQGGAKPGGAGGLGAQGGTAGKGGTSPQAGAGGAGAGQGGAAAGKSGSSGQGGGGQKACQESIDCGASTSCVTYSCENGSCLKSLATQGAPCQDNDVCNGQETCDGQGQCVPGTPPQVGDGNDCTSDSCDPVNGVQHDPVPNCEPCQEAKNCTQLPCQQAACISMKCSYKPENQGTICDDGDACTLEDTCDGAGQCVAGQPVVKTDNNKCTTDSCDPLTGELTHTDAVSCDSASCDANVGKAWAPACDPGTGQCTPNETQCAPGYGCDGDHCTTDCNGNDMLCRDGHVCEAGKCIVPKQPLGASCMEDKDCESNICRQGQQKLICGTDPCDGVCRVVRGDGMGCENAYPLTDPKDDCTLTENGCKSGETCNGQGACNKLGEGMGCPLFPPTGKCMGEKCL